MKSKLPRKNVSVATGCGAVINSNFNSGVTDAKRAFYNASRAKTTTIGTRHRRLSAVPGKSPTG